MSDEQVSPEYASTVPVHRIDLSSPPHLRYASLAAAYSGQIRRLTSLFDCLLADLGIPRGLHPLINLVSRMLLHRVHSRTETAELRGIAKTAGIHMYLLVCLNVVLDLLMGCTSGAARCQEAGESSASSKMLHFRTLDWTMDPLRSVIVQLDFFKSKSKDPGRTLSSSVTYVGFVGVLTGVRSKLSMSLNFRAVHDASTRSANFKFYLHHLLVLLGFRQSISSLLRSYLIGPMDFENGQEDPATLPHLAAEVPAKHSTAAYLIFSDGDSTITIDKDYKTAVVRESRSFIVVTNHDIDDALSDSNTHLSSANIATLGTNDISVFTEAIGESTDRRNRILEKWESKVRKAERQFEKRRKGYQPLNTSTRITHASSKSTGRSSTKATQMNLQKRYGHEDGDIEPFSVENSVAATKDEIIEWVTAFPTTNECTHFAAVLDPVNGQVAWVKRYLDPVESLSDAE